MDGWGELERVAPDLCPLSCALGTDAYLRLPKLVCDLGLLISYTALTTARQGTNLEGIEF
jgi:hypothetical protein